MIGAWTCKKCSTEHSPGDEGFSWWKCGSGTCTAYRWPGLLWIGGAVVGVGLVVLLWGMLGLLGGNAEETFLRQAKNVLKTEGKITSEGTEKLRQRAARLKLAKEHIEQLLTRAKVEYLEETRRALLHQPPSQGTMTPEKRKAFCQVAAALEMPAEDSLVPCSQDLTACSQPAWASNAGPSSQNLSFLQDLMTCLRQGEFTQAVQALQTMPEHPEVMTLRSVMDTPLGVQVQFQYQRGVESPSPLYPLESADLKGLVLSPRDVYRLALSTASDETYLYVFQQDRYGQMTRLFPDPVWSGVDNPIRHGNTYQIPPGSKEWVSLDELPPTQETAIQETLYIIASPWQAADLEALYGEVYAATSRESRAALLERFFARLRLREAAPIKAVYYKEFSFHHDR